MFGFGLFWLCIKCPFPKPFSKGSFLLCWLCTPEPFQFYPGVNFLPGRFSHFQTMTMWQLLPFPGVMESFTQWLESASHSLCVLNVIVSGTAIMTIETEIQLLWGDRKLSEVDFKFVFPLRSETLLSSNFLLCVYNTSLDKSGTLSWICLNTSLFALFVALSLPLINMYL